MIPMPRKSEISFSWRLCPCSILMELLMAAIDVPSLELIWIDNGRILAKEQPLKFSASRRSYWRANIKNYFLWIFMATPKRRPALCMAAWAPNRPTYRRNYHICYRGGWVISTTLHAISQLLDLRKELHGWQFGDQALSTAIPIRFPFVVLKNKNGISASLISKI
jgi:hypothetical protein